MAMALEGIKINVIVIWVKDFETEWKMVMSSNGQIGTWSDKGPSTDRGPSCNSNTSGLMKCHLLTIKPLV